MRKFQQKKINELLLTLKEAHSEIQKQLEPDTKVSLLADCQNFALEIGEYIERLEGEGTQTVRLLEEYCEAAYFLSIDITNVKRLKELSEKLNQISDSVIEEFKPLKIEMVFFPYQLSMFDSFESVYQAAKADPCCDVYVVPIPWYDKLSNGAFGAMHYDGQQYPESISITAWWEYNLEERHPDVIFIHNPYDDKNFVTTVHPNYYSKKLREYTDLLCYIPYFVCDGDVEEHFIETLGCINSHKVFLQSEKIRAIYINVFRKAYGNKFGKPEDKFVALGSPKFDKVINAREEDFDIPEEWLSIIENPKGERKKVVLYNTSIGSMLAGNEQYLKKLRHVLEVFKKRDDVVLWWRPHPLFKQTLQSMRPQLAKEYEQAVAEYKSDPYGVYDDTSLLHRAICMSDYYFGDRSSLVALYEAAGKPVLIQSVGTRDAVNGIRRVDLSIFDLYDDGERLWFSAIEYNALLAMDKQTLKVDYIGSFPNEDMYGARLYTTITESNGKLYFTPCSAHEIGVYDTRNKKFEKINIGLSRFDNDMSQIKYVKKFVSGFINDSLLTLVPCCYETTVVCDITNNNISCHNELFDYFYSKYRRHITSADSQFYLCWFAKRLNKTEIAFNLHSNTNIVVFYNLETRKFKEQKIGSEKRTFSLIEYDGTSLWLYDTKNDMLIRWKRENEECSEIRITDKLPDFKPCGMKNSFLNMAVLGDYLYLIPANTNFVIQVNIETLDLVIIDTLSVECSDQNEGIAYSNLCKVSDNKLYLFGNRSKQFVEYQQGGELRYAKLKLSDDFDNSIERQYFLDSLHNSHILLGEDRLSLTSFLNILNASDLPKSELASSKNGLTGKECGYKVYEYVKQIVHVGV